MLLLFCLSVTFSAHAQRTIAIEKKSGKKVVLSYSVLKGNTKVRHGTYHRYYTGHDLDGAAAGNNLAETGNYENGKRVGRWMFYHPNDTLEQRFNYTSNTVEYNNPPKEFEFELLTEIKLGDTLQNPVLIGGTSSIRMLNHSFSYPAIIRGRKDLNSDFRRTILIYVDENGGLENVEVLVASEKKKILYTYNKNSVRNNTDAVSFKPAKLNGKNVRSVIVYNYPDIVRVR